MAITYAERQKLKESDFVFGSERAFPVMSAGDVMNAVNSWGRYKGSKTFDEFKKALTALCKRKGFMSALPKNWQDAMGMAGKADLSLEDKRCMLSDAFSELTDPNSSMDMPMQSPHIEETYADYVIVCMGDDEYYKVGYSIDLNNNVTFDAQDKWTPVQETWAAKGAFKAAIKAVGDWELDVLAVPFGKPDSDGQIFDANTNFMLDQFSSPVIIYHHGIMPGKQSLQKTPTIIGKSQKVDVRSDGLHVRVLLDKTLEWAQRVWEAAKLGKAVASSDSISHLARLDVGGKSIMYEKDRPGRITVWPLAGLSLWDHVSGNFNPASRYALALPAMKAIYRGAGIAFPEISSLNINGDLSKANEAARRARIQSILSKSKTILAKAERKS